MNSSNTSIFDELDQAIDRVIADPSVPLLDVRTGIAELLEMAPDLLHLPRTGFKSQLRLELEWQASGRAISAAHRSVHGDQNRLASVWRVGQHFGHGESSGPSR